ncbi:MAG: MXAN_6640 family putative metalloprotease, partial [Nocardioides sp.]
VGARDATLARRELRRQLDELEGADRAQAAALLARPQLGRVQCFTSVCVHWDQGVATQDYVDQVGEISDDVLATYAAAGYRAPKPDGTRGGNALLDIYLEDLGGDGLYGYCDSSTPPTGSGPWDAPAYCAFDNDYAEFPSHTPTENLQVTAAHELFHAVQFAYDYYEDPWFMEATATWAEDELFDGVDDNVQYLAESPLTQPATSMDRSTGLRVYGDWIFFRFLSERFTDKVGGMPTVVRDIWRRADGATGGRDDYSIEAVANELASRRSSIRTIWARFAAANQRPAVSYDEGRANRYPSAGTAGGTTLTGKKRSATLTRRVDHLSAKTIRFKRKPGMDARKLRLAFDLPPTRRGSGAVATVYRKNASPTTTVLTTSLKGDGDTVARVAFGRRVKRVEVTMANAGIDYRSCWGGSAWSCQGRPVDDNLRMQVRGKALR